MSNEIERLGHIEQRRGPKSYVREDGFQIIPGVIAVHIEVTVDPHVSRTHITGSDMEAAMIVNWDDPESQMRTGSLQFGLRGIERVISSSEFTFRGEW